RGGSSGEWKGRGAGIGRVTVAGRARSVTEAGRVAPTAAIKPEGAVVLPVLGLTRRCHSSCSWAPVNTKSSDATKNGPVPAADAAAMLQSNNAAATAT